MQNNTNVPSDGDWNSDVMATPDMTCDQVARYLSAFSSGFRAFILASHQDDTGLARLESLANLLNAQIAMIKAKPELFDKDTIECGMMATGMAIAASTGNDPRTLGELATKAAETLVMLIEKDPDKYDACHVHYMVQNSDSSKVGMGSLKIGVKLVPMDELNDVLEKNEASSGVLKLLKNQPPSHGDN